jgi:hypothetical protein
MINFTLPLMLAKWGVSCAWFFTCAGIPSVISLFTAGPCTAADQFVMTGAPLSPISSCPRPCDEARLRFKRCSWITFHLQNGGVIRRRSSAIWSFVSPTTKPEEKVTGDARAYYLRGYIVCGILVQGSR